MDIGNGRHLTYCTNIHPGESWDEHFTHLRHFLPAIKNRMSPEAPFGVGLRLSNRASLDLSKPAALEEFRTWLGDQGLYVFTMNGFPFGRFHKERVKDGVHAPDWSAPERLAYTKRLAVLLGALLPQEISGSISTSPLSYKPWFGNENTRREQVFDVATGHLIEMIAFLGTLEASTGKLIHLDIEPEPDGLLANVAETADYFKTHLLPAAQKQLPRLMHCGQGRAATFARRHVRACFDVCHAAVGFEEPREAFDLLAQAGMSVGKIQISSALRAVFPQDAEGRDRVAGELRRFAEPVYLHQASCRDARGTIATFPDLDAAIETLPSNAFTELRTHFHVPVYAEGYGVLQSTRQSILDTLKLLPAHPEIKHIEVETYTWDVLPENERIDPSASIIRELEWVIQQMKGNSDA